VVSPVDQDVGGDVAGRKQFTILTTEASIDTASCWWDDLFVAEKSVVVSCMRGVDPPVILALTTCDSADEAQDWFQGRYRSARRFSTPHRRQEETCDG
jgi:hypothetical protein